MSSRHDSLLHFKTPSRKHTRESDVEQHLPKRRRPSISFGLVLRTELASAIGERIEDNSVKCNSGRDRFLPTLTTTLPFYGLHTTSARSARLARTLGLVQPRLLSYHDNTPPPLLADHLSDPTLPMRTYLSESLTVDAINPTSAYSAAKHGRKKPERVLDSGPMDELPLHPCAWSRTGVIAAVIRETIFMHDTEGNKVTKLPQCGTAASVEWTSDNELATGCSKGQIIVQNSLGVMVSHVYIPRSVDMFSFVSNSSPTEHCVNTMHWSPEQRVLAAGRETGEVTYIDLRSPSSIRDDMAPVKRSVTNVKWSPDGCFLASSYKGGIVRCMDWRANKALELHPSEDARAHQWTVTSLSWAPWNPRLLATGGGVRDHTIKIWSLSGSQPSAPLHILPFSSSVTSLHFSPHTTELLSTHGEEAAKPLISRAGSRRSNGGLGSRIFNTTSASNLPITRHGIMVHTYPSFEPVHAVPDAHSGPILDSVISPDGTRIMTFGDDETLRQWPVWSCRTPMTTPNMKGHLGIR